MKRFNFNFDNSNPYARRRELKSKIPGFLILVGFIILMIWLVKEIGEFVNELISPTSCILSSV